MSASRPTRHSPFTERRSEAMNASDANRFYTVPPASLKSSPSKNSRNFLHGENPFTHTKHNASKRLSPLQARHKAKNTKQVQRLSMLTLFLISLSIGMWMLGGMLIHAVQQQFIAPKANVHTTQEQPLEPLLTLQDSVLVNRGVPLAGVPHEIKWNSPTPLTPLMRPALLETQRNEALQTLVDRLSAEIEPSLRPHVLILDGQTLQFAGKRMEEEVPSASVIKLPLLYLYTLHLNSGALTNETPAYFDEHHMVSGSGDWQFLGAKKFYTAFQTAEAMIQNSDNSATELMTSLLGGKNEVTQELKDLGLHHTALRNILPDLEGYNTISVYDMVTLLFNLKEQPLLSTETKSTAMEILEGTRNRRLIPALLPPDTLVAHKTGDIGKSLGETALVYLPDGRYYYLSVMVERPHNHGAAKDYIQRLSKGIWDYYVAQTLEGGLSQPNRPSENTAVPSTPSGAEIF